MSRIGATVKLKQIKDRSDCSYAVGILSFHATVYAMFYVEIEIDRVRMLNQLQAIPYEYVEHPMNTL